MSGIIVQLPNQAIDPRGQRYTDIDKEAAYQLWRTAGGRSCRRVGEALGIHVNTLYDWRDKHAWIARADSEDSEDVVAIRHGVAALVTQQLVKNVQTAVEIRDNPENAPRDRMAAVQWLSGIAGVSPVMKNETAIVQQVQGGEVIEIVDLRGLSPDELMRREDAAKARKR